MARHRQGTHTLRRPQVPAEKLSDPAHHAHLVLRTAQGRGSCAESTSDSAR
jgi:hypothetical protein